MRVVANNASSTLVEEPYTIPNYTNILRDNGINHFCIKVLPNKDPAIKTSQQTMNEILEIILNKANHPILVHCNKGKVSALSIQSPCRSY